ncbi:unnamed protein product [Pelagomonas calceolata]|uniref:Uncharacterized protein n=1 Tax=Pelagomonas calceolata TaxID=35677 RepID=A0A8J2SWK6_9STRA|nr:unnamed protein product [Pelagomonas calceolata]
MGPPSSWPLLLLGWAAGADLATMAPAYCPPHAARTRGRELCPTDPVCAASVQRFATAKRHAPPRVAVLLRGVAFRNWGSRDTEGSCCRGTEASQRSVVESWDEHLFAPLEARGYEVNIYVATYRCSNGKDWVERDLLAQLAPRLRGVYLGSYDNTTQSATHARALALAHAESSSREDQPEGAGKAARAFEHVFIMRLDMALTRRSNLTCLLAQDGPMTRSEAGNADGFSYLPGRFFACAVRARAALYYSHDWVASVLSLAGVDAPAAGAPVLYAHAVGGRAQDACATRAWRHEKRSAETAARWLRARGRAAAADRARAACYAARRPSRDYQNR